MAQYKFSASSGNEHDSDSCVNCSPTITSGKRVSFMKTVEFTVSALRRSSFTGSSSIPSKSTSSSEYSKMLSMDESISELDDLWDEMTNEFEPGNKPNLLLDASESTVTTVDCSESSSLSISGHDFDEEEEPSRIEKRDSSVIVSSPKMKQRLFSSSIISRRNHQEQTTASRFSFNHDDPTKNSVWVHSPLNANRHLEFIPSSPLARRLSKPNKLRKYDEDRHRADLSVLQLSLR